MPKFTGQPKTLTIFEFKKEWMDYKKAAALSKQEGLAELKTAIQTSQRKAVLDMKGEEEIFTHLMTLFGNPKLLLAQRLDEARGWGKCVGTDVQIRDWLSTAKTRVESTYEIAKEYDMVLELLIMPYFEVVESKFPAEFVRKMAKRHNEKADESGFASSNIKIDVLLSFLTEKYTAYSKSCSVNAGKCSSVSIDSLQNGSAQSKGKGAQRGGAHLATHVGGSDGGDGGGNGNVDGNVLVANNSVGRGGNSNGRGGSRGRGQGGRGNGRGGAVQGSNSTGNGSGTGSAATFNPKQCLHCQKEHPFMYYCEEFMKASIADRFSMVFKQKSCTRCLGMGRRHTGPKATWWLVHEGYCKTRFACVKDTCASLAKINQRHITVSVSYTHLTLPTKRIV